jgi:hypothetical protein
MSAVKMAYLHSNKPMNIHTYIHTFIHSYIHTFIHSYIHTFIHSYIHTFIHSYIHSYIHTFIHSYIYIYATISTIHAMSAVKMASHSLDVPTFRLNAGALIEAKQWTSSEESKYWPDTQFLTDFLLTKWGPSIPTSRSRQRPSFFFSRT